MLTCGWLAELQLKSTDDKVLIVSDLFLNEKKIPAMNNAHLKATDTTTAQDDAKLVGQLQIMAMAKGKQNIIMG